MIYLLINIKKLSMKGRISTNKAKFLADIEVLNREIDKVISRVKGFVE